MTALKGAVLSLLLAAGAAACCPASSAAEERRELVAPYLRGLEGGQMGQVDGHASGLPRRASGAAVALDGVSVVLLPKAAEVAAKLDAIKVHLRESIATYVDAYADVTALREGYERELLAAGGGQLIRGEVSDGSGRFRLEGVPAGEWLLVAWRQEEHAVKAARAPSKDASKYPDIQVLTGYGSVTYWRMQLTVRAGEATPAELSDRSVWLTAVREELSQASDMTKKGADSTKKKRR